MGNKKVLLLGNGLNQSFGSGSWGDLLNNISKHPEWDGNTFDSPMPLRAILLTDDNIKGQIEAFEAARIKKAKKEQMDPGLSPFYGSVSEGQHANVLRDILSIGFDRILSTNYSYEIEIASRKRLQITESQLFHMQDHTDIVKRADPKYLLHTFLRIDYNGINNEIWHIHGEARKHDSMLLGHYYYGNLLFKIKEYVDKLGYRYKKMAETGEEIQRNSWIDSFLLDDLYILGFGFNLSEFDLWWLLNRRKNEVYATQGRIYFYEPAAPFFSERIELLKIFGAEHVDLGFRLPDAPKDDNDKVAVQKYKDDKDRTYKEFYLKAIEDIKNRVTQERK